MTAFCFCFIWNTHKHQAIHVMFVLSTDANPQLKPPVALSMSHGTAQLCEVVRKASSGGSCSSLFRVLSQYPQPITVTWTWHLWTQKPSDVAASYLGLKREGSEMTPGITQHSQTAKLFHTGSGMEACNSPCACGCTPHICGWENRARKVDSLSKTSYLLNANSDLKPMFVFCRG